MIGKILILLVLFNLSESGSIRRFSCNQPSTVHELNNANSLIRLVRDKNHYYFIFQDYILFIKSPSLFDAQKKYYVKEDDIYENKYMFEHATFYQQDNKESRLPEEIPTDHDVLGHYLIQHENKVVEFYYKKSPRTEYSQGFLAERYDRVYYLNFKGDVLARRDQIEDSEKFFTSYFKFNYETNLVLYGDQNYVNSIVETGHQLYARFEKSNIGRGFNRFYIVIHNLDINIYEKEFILQGSAYDTHFFNLSYTKLFVVDDFQLPDLRVSNLGHFSILGFNADRSTIQLARIDFNFYIPKDRKDYLYFDYSFIFDFEINELFSCHIPFIHDREVKGIYYNQEKKVFFIFVNRFYLQLTDDLVSNGFYFDDDVYKNNAFDLEFENEQIYETLYFERLKRKWIKTYPDDVYFIPSERPDNHFILGIDEKQKLTIKKESGPDNRIECIKQTFILENYFYCFSEKSYFHRDRHKDLISDIFENSPVEWDSDQVLKFIFNYKPGYLIFLTETHLFIFKYANFEVVKRFSEQIKYKNVPDFKPTQKQSCLFEKCEGPVIETTTIKPTTETTTMKPTTNVITIKPTTETATIKTTTKGTTINPTTEVTTMKPTTEATTAKLTTKQNTIEKSTTEKLTTESNGDDVLTGFSGFEKNETEEPDKLPKREAEELARAEKNKNVIKFLLVLFLILTCVGLLFYFIKMRPKSSLSLKKFGIKSLKSSPNRPADLTKMKKLAKSIKTLSKSSKSSRRSSKRSDKLSGSSLAVSPPGSSTNSASKSLPKSDKSIKTLSKSSKSLPKSSKGSDKLSGSLAVSPPGSSTNSVSSSKKSRKNNLMKGHPSPSQQIGQKELSKSSKSLKKKKFWKK